LLYPFEQKPGQEFNGLIEKFWLIPRERREAEYFEILPDGNFDLVFMLNDSCCRVLYTGPYTELRRIPFFGGHDYFCVRFRPGRMPRLDDVAASDLVNSWAVLPKVLGVAADELGERLYRARGIAEKQRTIESLFRKAGVERSLPKGPFLQYAAAVEETGGAIRVGELAQRSGVTSRTLERMFRQHTGLSPKTFARMVRFQTALTRLRDRTVSGLADLAAQCGYADQSHFIKEFKALSRRLPTEI
jgi:AraC-like DNA-binding protein